MVLRLNGYLNWRRFLSPISLPREVVGIPVTVDPPTGCFPVTIATVKDDDEAIRLGVAVRRVQQKCKLTQVAANSVARIIKKQALLKCDLRAADRKLKRKSCVQLVTLHGCVNVDDNGTNCTHVFGAKDRRNTCPICGHFRFQEGSTTRANETVYWFPLKPRIEALLQLASYRSLLQVTFAMVCLAFILACCTVLFL